MQKNGFLTFCFSLIPGAGQMYLGLMKRGLSIMVLAGVFAICMFELGSILFVVPFLIIMAYSFFDTYRIRDCQKRGEGEEDAYIIQPKQLKNIRGNRLIGAGLILIGAYLLFTKTLGTTFDYWNFSPFLNRAYWAIRRCLPSLIAACLAIGVGVRMIAGDRDE